MDWVRDIMQKFILLAALLGAAAAESGSYQGCYHHKHNTMLVNIQTIKWFGNKWVGGKLTPSM